MIKYELRLKDGVECISVGEVETPTLPRQGESLIYYKSKEEYVIEKVFNSVREKKGKLESDFLVFAKKKE